MSPISLRANQFQFQVSVGKIVVTWNSSGFVTRIDWFAGEPELDARQSVPRPAGRVIGLLRDYFACGKPIGEVPWEMLDQTEWTPFQKQVYATIAQIPHGETRTYGWVASRVQKVFATRAVGQALRNNPLPVLIPCHRVVAVNSLGGFMGALDPEQPELRLKRSLLELELEFLNPPFAFMFGEGGREVERPRFAEDALGQLDFFLPIAPFGLTGSCASGATVATAQESGGAPAGAA